MGFTQGKRPSGVKIGKVHKIMNGNTVVFRDATSSLDDLIARVQENPVHLMLADVTIEEPGHPIEGENWRPQLAPYKPWVHDAALDETEELDGTDGDLLIVGALMMMEVMNIDFNDFTEGFPAFMTIIMMPLTYSISNGIGIGAIAYVLITLFTGKYKKNDIGITIIAALFVIKFVFVTM